LVEQTQSAKEWVVVSPLWRGRSGICERSWFYFDKKNLAGETRFAIPVALGTMAARDGRWTVAVPEDDIAKGLATIL